MKINELMIGDWVSVNGLNLKVGAIHADEIGVFDPDYKIYWCSDDGLDRIDPIPLTEDILVKNGFERCDYNNKYFIIDDAIDLITPKWRGGTEYYACAWYQDEFDDLVQHIEICKCAYVHQLQHLLRLAGVQKEIEL